MRRQKSGIPENSAQTNTNNTCRCRKRSVPHHRGFALAVSAFYKLEHTIHIIILHNILQYTT